jgi:SAM-dependent methyltransferase
MTSFNWYYGLDFGCGAGRNIPLLAKLMNKGWRRHIFAVDADAERLQLAKQTSSRLSDENVNIEYILASGDKLQGFLGNVLFDLILCCQVFTHMSRAEFRRTVDTFKSTMTKDGILVVCVPFHCLPIDGDYYHKVAVSQSLETGELKRTLMSPGDYDRAATTPTEGVLPVRAFKLRSRLPAVRARDLPLPVEAPRAFSSLEGLRVVSCMAYSIHHYDENDMPVIGDLIMKLRMR